MPAHEQMAAIFADGTRMARSCVRDFAALTSAHELFPGAMGSSPSRCRMTLDDGGIEVVFMDVRIRFQMMMMFNDAFEPRGRVVCTHCHCAYGSPVQDKLGGFTFDREGITDLETCLDSPAILLR